jgi:hypothetical protein
MVAYGIECPSELARWQHALGHRIFEILAQPFDDPARLRGSKFPSLLVSHRHRAMLELENRIDGFGSP